MGECVSVPDQQTAVIAPNRLSLPTSKDPLLSLDNQHFGVILSMRLLFTNEPSVYCKSFARYPALIWTPLRISASYQHSLLSFGNLAQLLVQLFSTPSSPLIDPLVWQPKLSSFAFCRVKNSNLRYCK